MKGQEMRGDGRQTKGEVENEMDENVLQFEGIIYGLPGAPPGSQFVLKAHVYSEVMSTGLSTQIAQDEQTVAGRIVRRRVELGRHISSHSSGPDGMNDDHMDGKISIMPKGEDVGLEGIERRQDPNQLSSDTRKPSFIARSRTLKRVQRSLMFPAASRNLYNRLLNGRSRLGGKHTRKSAITDNHQQPSPNSEEQSSLFQSFDNPVTPNSEILS